MVCEKRVFLRLILSLRATRVRMCSVKAVKKEMFNGFRFYLRYMGQSGRTTWRCVNNIFIGKLYANYKEHVVRTMRIWRFNKGNLTLNLLKVRNAL